MMIFCFFKVKEIARLISFIVSNNFIICLSISALLISFTSNLNLVAQLLTLVISSVNVASFTKVRRSSTLFYVCSKPSLLKLFWLYLVFQNLSRATLRKYSVILDEGLVRPSSSLFSSISKLSYRFINLILNRYY